MDRWGDMARAMVFERWPNIPLTVAEGVVHDILARFFRMVWQTSPDRDLPPLQQRPTTEQFTEADLRRLFARVLDEMQDEAQAYGDSQGWG